VLLRRHGRASKKRGQPAYLETPTFPMRNAALVFWRL